MKTSFKDPAEDQFNYIKHLMLSTLNTTLLLPLLVSSTTLKINKAVSKFDIPL